MISEKMVLNGTVANFTSEIKLKSWTPHPSSNWRDYVPPSRCEVDAVKQLTERVAQLDCAMEGHEERIAELEQTVQELRAFIKRTDTQLVDVQIHVTQRK